MSGGEQQQLAIARALMSHPQLLIFDEPSLGLSPKLVDQVFALVQKLHKEGMTILLVEQNVAQALNIADRAYLIRMGRVEAAGTPQELRQTVDVESAYLGAATAQAASGREL
jgi:branched-chain amino acid transport system ATP-binding protein